MRNQFIKAALESCRHFNGIQNKVCKAGIEYRHDGKDTASPCIPKFIKGRPAWPCDLFEIMSQQDAEREADERILSMERGTKAYCAAKADADSKGYKKGHGGAGSLPCPCCDGGTLRYTVASYNGHMHGRCSTEGCVWWMQ